MRRVGGTGKPPFFIDENDAVRTVWTPLPHHEIEISRTCPRGKTPNSHPRIARRDQAVGQGLRCRDHTRKHFRFPSGACKVGMVHTQRPTLIFIQRIDNRLDIDLIGAQGERLHRPAQWLRLAYGGQWREGGIERRDAAPVETPAMTASPLAGQRRPGPLRIVRPVSQAPESHQESANSGIAAGHDAVEIGVYVVGPAFAQQLIRCGATETAQRLGAEPSIGGER